jgi:hypothetical protein
LNGSFLPANDLRAADTTVLLMFDDADNNETDPAFFAATNDHNTELYKVSKTMSGADKVCAQLLSSPVQSPFPVPTVASTKNISKLNKNLRDNELKNVVIPSINVFIVRALYTQNFNGAAYTIQISTLTALDAHVSMFQDSTNNQFQKLSELSSQFPYAFDATDYTQCYGNQNGSCGGQFGTSSASAASYILLVNGDAPTPEAMANIGLVGTEIFVGIELFVMVAIAVGFILIAVRLLRQIQGYEQLQREDIRLTDVTQDDAQHRPLLGQNYTDDVTVGDADDDNDDVIHDDALASDFLNVKASTFLQNPSPTDIGQQEASNT